MIFLYFQWTEIMIYLDSVCTQDFVPLRAFVRSKWRELTVLDTLIPGDTFLAYLAAFTIPNRSETHNTH